MTEEHAKIMLLMANMKNKALKIIQDNTMDFYSSDEKAGLLLAYVNGVTDMIQELCETAQKIYGKEAIKDDFSVSHD